MQRLLIASENKKKLAELTRLLAPLGFEALLPSAIGGLPKVDEDRPTFRENAEKKASSAARASGLWSLADDSGLEVEALNGAPGVLSARFAGRHGDDAANNELLLAKLADVPEARRGARFVCALALARPDGSIALTIEGTAKGRILFAPRGDGDFGYDPLFLFTEPGFAQTGKGFAELSLDEKSTISHRGRALAELVRRLRDLPELHPAQ
ncbi:MAG: RdgB/HAM1 family non-canonical purine NTP pyrophosphatase [Planctomycetes bacterium]|nr:RdgB/HAM1 family non-canonical purine NTP pyrophosphatase [Planctomycetota bacterium]